MADRWQKTPSTMTQQKLTQKLCDLIMKISDADPGDYSNIYDAVQDILNEDKNLPKNPLQKAQLSGMIFGEFDDILGHIEQNWDVPVTPYSKEEEQELEEIMSDLKSFITRKYDL